MPSASKDTTSVRDADGTMIAGVTELTNTLFGVESKRVEIVCSASQTVKDRAAVLNAYVLHGATLRATERSNVIENWPSKTRAVCWHCAGPVSGVPVPACKFKSTLSGQYHVYGIFCSAACALGDVAEHAAYDRARQLMWTREVLHKSFGLDFVDIAFGPPRHFHERFSGPLSDVEFHSAARIDADTRVASEPMISFQDLIRSERLSHGAGASAAARNEDNEDNEDDDMSAGMGGQWGKTRGLRRPKVRGPFAEPTPTGRPPLFLDFLARKRAALLETRKQFCDDDESDAASATHVSKRARGGTTRTTRSAAARENESASAQSGLTKFMRRQK